MEARLTNSLNSFESIAIQLDVGLLGRKINELIQDVGQLYVVTAGDLTIFGSQTGLAPADVAEAMGFGTKFFDAVYYFAMDAAIRPPVAASAAAPVPAGPMVMEAKRYLLWTAIFLMLRGSYPESAGNVVGTDVPAFLRNICGMTVSPQVVARGLASFELQKINPEWIRSIQWSGLAQPIRQRLGLGLAGYRQLGPFRLYPCRPDASEEARAAFAWVRQVTQAPADYAVLSCTRSAALIGQLGSWNKALGNLMIECFTAAQLAEMAGNRIIFAVPTRDVRSDNWRAWPAGGALALNDPIGL